MQKTLRGPNGMRLELDSREVIVDDPGAGTPAMVYKGDHSATFFCAVDTGELSGTRPELIHLNDAEIAWLDQQWETVDNFLHWASRQ